MYSYCCTLPMQHMLPSQNYQTLKKIPYSIDVTLVLESPHNKMYAFVPSNWGFTVAITLRVLHTNSKKIRK